MNSRTLAALGLTGWTPIRLFWANGEPCVEWARFDPAPFHEPFFEQSLSRVVFNPARLLFRRQTSADVLEAIGREVAGERPANSERPSQELAERAEASGQNANASSATSAHSCDVSGSHARATTEAAPGAIVPPAGFVFHSSRCGSTLICQMLAALPGHVVLSEASPIEQVLTAHQRDRRITRERRVAWLRGLVYAMCQPRTGAERCAFIKFECLQVLELALITEAFPGVPWIFLYRDPVEVLVSVQRAIPGQMLPGVVDCRRFGIEPALLPQLSLEEYAARVLAAVFTAGRDAARQGGGRLVNFTELPSALWTVPDGLFPMAWTASEIAQMQTASRRDAKDPSRPHTDDRATKQREASEMLRQQAFRWLAEPYAQLEAERASSRGRDDITARREIPATVGIA